MQACRSAALASGSCLAARPIPLRRSAAARSARKHVQVVALQEKVKDKSTEVDEEVPGVFNEIDKSNQGQAKDQFAEVYEEVRGVFKGLYKPNQGKKIYYGVFQKDVEIPQGLTWEQFLEKTVCIIVFVSTAAYHQLKKDIVYFRRTSGQRSALQLQPISQILTPRSVRVEVKPEDTFSSPRQSLQQVFRHLYRGCPAAALLWRIICSLETVTFLRRYLCLQVSYYLGCPSKTEQLLESLCFWYVHAY